MHLYLELIIKSAVGGMRLFGVPTSQPLLSASRSGIGSPQDKTASNKARQYFAREVYEECLFSNKSAGQSISSTHSTWFPILRGAIQHTSEDDVPRQDWIAGLASAMAAVETEWVPGSHRGRLTSRRVVKLVGISKPKHFLAGPSGSLKRAAMEAEHRMALERESILRGRRGRQSTLGARSHLQQCPS